jgi:hypothetical protein
MTDFVATIAAQRLLPGLRIADPEAAVRRATELLQAGLRVVEARP